MAKQTVLEEVKTRMREMQESKAGQLEEIRQKQDEARSQIEAAALAMKHAMTEMNIDSYETAKAQKRRALTALDMYSGRYDQIRQQEYISESESDAIIDSLLEYENQLAEGFKTAAAGHLKALAELLKNYRAEVQDTENTLTSWQQNIHANYSTRGETGRFDSFTGEWTDKSKKPVPVHRLPYIGCSEAKQLESYLEKAKELYGG